MPILIGILVIVCMLIDCLIYYYTGAWICYHGHWNICESKSLTQLELSVDLEYMPGVCATGLHQLAVLYCIKPCGRPIPTPPY